MEKHLTEQLLYTAERLYSEVRDYQDIVLKKIREDFVTDGDQQAIDRYSFDWLNAISEMKKAIYLFKKGQ